MALKFGHEALAEAHHFIVALALRVEVGTAFAAAHRERGEGVLEDLFEAEEFEDAEVDARVEAEAALVRSDGAVEFDAVGAVDLHITLVVDPRYTEDDGAFRLDDAFEDGGIFVLLVGGKYGFDCGKNFLHGLQEFGSEAFLALTPSRTRCE